jgi:multidrug efflux pump subunit AcrB
MTPFPEVSALEDSLAYDKEELILSLTPQGQALGFGIDTLGRALRERLNGIEAATFPDGPRTAAIRVELPASELTADFLDSTLLRASPGVYVPLGDIVTVDRRSGFSTIRRENGLRIVTVSGDIAEDDPARAAEVQRVLTEEILPKLEQDFGVTTRQSGLAQQEREFLGDASLGLMLCLLGIYMVLAWVFASWTRPVVVMVVIPFGLIGAIYGHHVWGVPMSLFSIVGMIGMTGIIINDSIVLVSTIDEYSEKRGMYPAIIDAVADRLRPVFLTTATTVLGLAPLLYERSSQAEFLRPTVITLVYGLGFGMLLVLFLVPAVLAVQADLGRQFRALRRGLGAQAAPRARGLLWGAGAVIALWFSATLGWFIATGAALGPLPNAGLGAAFSLFMGGAVVVLIAVYALGIMVLRAGPSGRSG